MQRKGTTYAGHVEHDLGEIRVVLCDACRTIAVDAWDARRKRRSWGITYVDPKTAELGCGSRGKGRLRDRAGRPLRRALTRRRPHLSDSIR